MTYSQFTSQPELVERANKVLNDPFIVELIGAVMSGPPSAVFPLPSIGSSESDKSMKLGMEYGFRFFHDRLIGLGIEPVATEELQARYAPEK